MSLIKIELPDEGGSMWVEVDALAAPLPEDAASEEPVANPADLARELGRKFVEALDATSSTARFILTKIRSNLHEPADEIEVKFGLKVNTEFGAVVAHSGLEGNYEVRLMWKSSSPDAGSAAGAPPAGTR